MGEEHTEGWGTNLTRWYQSTRVIGFGGRESCGGSGLPRGLGNVKGWAILRALHASKALMLVRSN